MNTEKNNLSSNENISAELIEDRLLIWDHSQGTKLYYSGYFGKPLGIRKPKGNEFDRPLELSLIEGAYLLKNNKIKIYEQNKNNEISFDNLYNAGKKYVELFEEKFIIYEDIRKKGLVLRPGLKFGADFAVYHHGPGLDHSPYVVTALPRGSNLTAMELVRAGRLATSVRKKFVIATILPSNEVRYYGFIWQKP